MWTFRVGFPGQSEAFQLHAELNLVMGSLDGKFWLLLLLFITVWSVIEFRLSDSVMSAFSVASGNWITLSWSACRQLLIVEAAMGRSHKVISCSR
ncbi:uncharacterized protein [Bemisia tabaci]